MDLITKGRIIFSLIVHCFVINRIIGYDEPKDVPYGLRYMYEPCMSHQGLKLYDDCATIQKIEQGSPPPQSGSVKGQHYQ